MGSTTGSTQAPSATDAPEELSMDELQAQMVALQARQQALQEKMAAEAQAKAVAQFTTSWTAHQKLAAEVTKAIKAGVPAEIVAAVQALRTGSSELATSAGEAFGIKVTGNSGGNVRSSGGLRDPMLRAFARIAAEHPDQPIRFGQGFGSNAVLVKERSGQVTSGGAIAAAAEKALTQMGFVVEQFGPEIHVRTWQVTPAGIAAGQALLAAATAPVNA